MTASIQNKNGFMYVVLCYDKNGVKKYKWVATGLKEKGNKKLLKAQLDSYIEKYSYLEDDIPAEDTYFVPYLKKWLSNHRDEVAKSTGEAYDVVANAHIIPYFEEKDIKLDDITPRVISEFYMYLHTAGNHKTGEGGFPMHQLRNQPLYSKAVSTMLMCLNLSAQTRLHR